MITIHIYNSDEREKAHEELKKSGFSAESVKISAPVVIRPFRCTEQGLLRSLAEICGVEEPLFNHGDTNREFLLEVRAANIVDSVPEKK